jgi:hypothetical protein
MEVLITTSIWYCLYQLRPNDITRNYLSAIHATSVILFYLSSMNILYLYYISMGYYLADIIHEITTIQKTITLYQVGVIVHHAIVILSLHTLFDIYNAPYYYKAFFLAEISNFPLYVHGHLMLINYPNRTVINIMLVIQILAYTILRLYLWYPIIYNIYMSNNFHYHLMLSVGIIYFISIVWIYKLLIVLRKSMK